MKTPIRLLAALLLSTVWIAAPARAQISVQWLKQYGSLLDDVPNALTVDGLGQIWVTGYTEGVLGGPRAGVSDIFLSRLSPTGNVDFTRQRGGVSSEGGRGVAMVGNNAVFVSGTTNSNFDGTVQIGDYDNVVMRFDGGGIWQGTARTGSTAYDQAYGAAGNSSYFLASGDTSGPFDGQTYKGSQDAFLTKRDSTGALVWTRFAGTLSTDVGRDATFDSAGNAYLTGKTFSNFPGFINAGSGDIFVARYDEAGNRTMLTQYGVIGDDNAAGMQVDASGNIYVVGYTHGPFGNYDCVLTKLSSAGAVLWTRYLGGSDNDQGRGVGLDSTGHVWVGGSSSSSFGGHVHAGSGDAFVAEYDTSGNLLATTFFATAGQDTIYDLAMGPDDAAYVTGVTAEVLGGANAGRLDVFVAKIVPEPSAWVLLATGFASLLARRRKRGAGLRAPRA